MGRVSAANRRNTCTKQVARQPGVLILLLIAGLVCAATTPVLAGTARAWGGNPHGELGNGTSTDSSVPVEVSGLSNVTTIAGGFIHSLALKTDGTVWAWGNNDAGQLGNGTTYTSGVPVEVSGLSNITAIAAGGGHSLALKTDGTVWAWGDNRYGELGNGTTTGSDVPVEVSGLSNVTAIAGGSLHSLALKTDGTVWAWGDNTYGELGNGTTTSSSVPVQFTGLSNVTAIAGGGEHSLALKTDGTVWAWGYNQYGQLGNGTTTESIVPVEVSGLANVTAIAGGDEHSLALKTDGTVWAWGFNEVGQLGNGTITNSDVPVEVSGLSNVTAIAGGGYHSLALKTDGTVWAWGDNTYGELGNGTTTSSDVPVEVTGLSNVTTIAGGFDHSLAVAGSIKFTWNGGVDDWFNSSAWTPHGVPGPGDTAVINGGTATANAAVNVAEIDLGGSGTLGGTGIITVSNTFNFTGGTLQGTGKLDIPAGAGLQFAPSPGATGSTPGPITDNRAIDILGSASWTGGGDIYLGQSATLNNSGAFDISNGGTLSNADKSAPSLNNGGTLTKSAGTGTVTLGVNFNNQGTTTVKSGTLQFMGVGQHSGAFVADGASFDFNAGTDTLTATSSITGTGDVLFSGATVVDAGIFNITGITVTTAGSVMFTRPATITSMLAVAGTLNFAGGFTQTSGTTMLAGGSLVSTNGINIEEGSVTGSGTLSGAVTNNGAISPGTPTQLGDVMVSGDLTELPNGVINLRVGAPLVTARARGRQSATASDVVIVNGVAHLAGTLNVMIPSGTAVSNLKVMSYNSHDGFFANILGVASPNRVDVGSKAVTVTSDPTGSLATGVRMVSVPYDFSASGLTAADLFQVAPLSDGTMPIATWDPVRVVYGYYPELPGTQAQPGRGYWIRLNTAKTITAVGNPVSSPFVQTLSPGWNMIGDPFTTPVAVNTLQFSAGVALGSHPANSSLSFATATAAGLVDSTLYGYSGSGYVATTTLQPYSGYWIYIDPTTSQNQPVQVTFTQQ